MSNEQKSNCCSAPIRVGSGDEGTNWYECEKCNRPCDTLPKAEGGWIQLCPHIQCRADMVHKIVKCGECESLFPKVEEGETYQTAPIALHGKNITCSQCEPLTKEISTLKEGLSKCEELSQLRLESEMKYRQENSELRLAWDEDKIKVIDTAHKLSTLTSNLKIAQEALERILQIAEEHETSEVNTFKIIVHAKSALTKLRSGG